MELHDVVELKMTLERLDREAARTTPFIVEISSQQGDVLSIGLGRTESVACFIPYNRSEPSFISVGERSKGAPVSFVFHDETSEFRRESVISKPLALNAALEFFESGGRPTNIKWEYS
jgi:hypothetical protein